MSELEKKAQSRRDFLAKGLTALAYAAPVVAVLAADKAAEAAAAAPAQKMKMMGEGMGMMGMGHGKS
jgi:hypothetical protein